MPLEHQMYQRTPIEAVEELQERLDLRSTLVARLNALDAEIKDITSDVRDYLGANALPEWEDDRYKVAMIYPADRVAISRDKLLLEGVPVEKIQAATTTTPVLPYVKITAKKVKTEA